MIFLNTDDRTSFHVASMRRSVTALGYNGTAPVVTEILYDDGKTRKQKALYAFTRQPGGQDDNTLYLDMVSGRLYRLNPGVGYVTEYTNIASYFADDAQTNIAQVQTYVDTQIDQVEQTIQQTVETTIQETVAQDIAEQVTSQLSAVGAFLSVQGRADLTAVENAALNDRSMAFVEDENAFFHYDLQAATAVDAIDVVATKTGTGRWIRVEDENVDGGTF